MDYKDCKYNTSGVPIDEEDCKDFISENYDMCYEEFVLCTIHY